jgi:hypothetical protein
MTTSLIEIPCQTVQDARQRVYLARLGSLAGATPEYIQELQLQLRLWVQSVDQEMAVRIQRSIETEVCETESYRTSPKEAEDATP